MNTAALHMAANQCYGVMLRNAAEKDDEQLQKILQEYGKIQEVQRGGVNAFVYFKEYTEARECINALSNHHIYQAKPARPRETNNGFFRESRPFNKGNRDGMTTFRSRSESKPNRSYESYTKKEYPNGEYKTYSNNFRNPSIYQSREGFSLGSQLLPVTKIPKDPPHLISAKDLWEDQQSKQFVCPATVVVTNLPVNIAYIDLFRMCSKLARIHDMELVPRNKKELPRYAKIGMASLEEAATLVSNLHSHKLMGKTLKAEIVQTIFEKK